ncbi:MAG: pentapeptide repeat-containing protein [Oscillospiraceae bacterium]
MDCALWLNRRKVFSASEISDNLDTASLLGYFAAGSLVEWLYEHGGEEYAKKLEKLSPADKDIREKIEQVFKGKPVAYRTLGSESAAKCASVGISCSSYRPSSIPSSMRGSFRLGSGGSFVLSSFLKSFRTGSGKSGSFYNYVGSFYLGSFLFGSGFHEWEWEWEWEKFFGSFFKTSFRFGSGLSARLAFLRSFGSFNFGSFSFGSYRFGSFDFGSFNFGSFRGNGSFGVENLPELPPFLQNLDEYDRIMLLSLYGCPLNQFGYGIHNI